MEGFYQDLLQPIFYHWIETHEYVYPTDDRNIFAADLASKHGTIHFYDDQIVELMIYDTTCHKDLFYLHFEIIDLKTALEQFNTFFEFLSHDQCQEVIELEKKPLNNILISCSGGFTSAYFAYVMQGILDKENIPGHIEAVAYGEIDNLKDDYNIILLAPQMAYKFNDLKARYSGRVMVIKSYDYATKNYKNILETISNEEA